jgi:hypothetical protein
VLRRAKKTHEFRGGRSCRPASPYGDALFTLPGGHKNPLQWDTVVAGGYALHAHSKKWANLVAGHSNGCASVLCHHICAGACDSALRIMRMGWCLPKLRSVAGIAYVPGSMPSGLANIKSKFWKRLLHSDSGKELLLMIGHSWRHPALCTQTYSAEFTRAQEATHVISWQSLFLQLKHQIRLLTIMAHQFTVFVPVPSAQRGLYACTERPHLCWAYGPQWRHRRYAGIFSPLKFPNMDKLLG